jgi:acyl-coenzyme A synthetase/AMP-(fatty) acid ligase
MKPITLFTSGSTKEPKQITHRNINIYIQRSVKEIGLTKSDIVLDVFPANVIAHYTVTAQPALAAGAHLITANFEPYNYIRLFKEYQPTYIALIPRHIEILEKTKGWENLDMSCVRYMVTGSQPVSMVTINMLRSKGVQLIANWYGMTEFPPPVLIAYDSNCFNLSSTDYDITFTGEGECVINGQNTGDIFDMHTQRFLERKDTLNGNTWKTNV